MRSNAKVAHFMVLEGKKPSLLGSVLFGLWVLGLLWWFGLSFCSLKEGSLAGYHVIAVFLEFSISTQFKFMLS